MTSGIYYCQNIQPFLAGTACPALLNFLVQYNFMVIYYHGFWELFTSIFVTNSLDDAFLNAIAVIILDLFMTSYINRTRYFAIFFATAIFGNLLTLLQGPLYSSAGASGGIFGLFAASFSFIWAEEKRIDKPTLAIFLIIFLASSLPLQGNLQVNWVAHVGGSLAGFIAGPLLYLSLKPELSEYSLTSFHSKHQALIFILILILVLGSAAQFLSFIFGY